MKRKAISSLLAASVICSAYTAPAFALTADMEPSLSKFNTAERTFFSIQTQQTNASNHFQLMKDTLLSKPANCDKTLLEAWAAIACGIFADNPSSYMYSTKNEDEFGRLKHLCDFQNKFTHDVRKGESYAGSLYQLLSSPSGTYQHTDDAVLSSAKYRENVITSSTGLQSASNLNQVQEEAFRQLHGLNDGYDTTPQKFKQYHEIKTMTDTAKDGTPALYSMMATRERVDSMTEAYYYNLFGVAFYDFALEGLGGKKYTLSDEQVQEALQNAKPGENIKIDGLEYTVAPGKTEIIPNKNDSGRDTDFTNTTGTTETTTETDTNASVTAFKKGGEISKNVEVHFGKDNGIKAGVSEKESQEQSQQTTTTHSDSTSEQRKNETSKKTSIPKYTAAELEENNSTTTIKRDYEQTVFLTYKTAVFSMNGLYHGRDFDEGGFQQRTFFTQFGNDQDNTSAWSSLKARTDNETDRGFDAANGITRLFGKSRSRSFFWHYNTTNFTWDTPFLNSLRWDEIQNKMNVLGLNGPETIRQLTTQLPVASLTGTYSKQTCTKQIELKDFIPTRPLTNVFLKNSAQAAGTVNQSESFPLNAVELRGIIANGSEFYGFTASKGTWKPVDENGNPVNKCALGSVVKDQSGNMIFKAAANAKGTVRLKYFVNDNAYRIYAGPGATTPVDSAKVASPVITLNIQSDSDTFNGKIETPKEVSVTYTPGKAVDLTKVKGLQVNVFDAKGFQAEKPTKWDLKKSGGAKLDGNQLTVSEDGTYQIRAIYGNVFSDWTQIHAKAEQKPQQKTEQKAEQKAEQKTEQKAEQKPQQKTVPYAKPYAGQVPVQEEQPYAEEETDGDEAQYTELYDEQEAEQPQTAPARLFADLGNTAAALLAFKAEEAGNRPDAAHVYEWADRNVDRSLEAAGFKWACDCHYFDSFDSSSLRADNPVTRQELAVILYRAFGNVSKAEEQNLEEPELKALKWAEACHMNVSDPCETVKFDELLQLIVLCSRNAEAAEQQIQEQETVQKA